MSKKEPKMISCRKCGQTIASTAKVCPHCGAKNAQPFYRRPWFITMIVLIVVGTIGGAAGNNKSKQPISSKPESSTSTVSSSADNMEASKPEKESSTAASEPEITYTSYEVGQLVDELKENALKAADKHKGEYVELIGKLSVVDSSGRYISIERSDGEFTFLEDIQCYIKSDEQKNVIMDLSTDDVIIVKGKIKDVGEIMGYSLDIDEIHKK